MLENSLSLHSEYIVAEKLGMTHKRLLSELGPGEMAYWLAKFEIDYEREIRARKEAERDAKLAMK